jgi:hypothetical protein
MPDSEGRARARGVRATAIDGQATLPHIDEHAIAIEADAQAIWSALTKTVEDSFAGAGQALITRALGCADCANGGRRPLAQGSTLPGFRVSAAVPEGELSLEGHHRFSRYSLRFHIDELDRDRFRVRAETRAAFPGAFGRGYRALVIGSGGHVLVVRGMLAAVKRRAERAGR